MGAIIIRFLLIGDRHAGPSAPLARIDDFEASFRDKDLEILKIARENNVDAIIEAGDFFEEGRTRLSNEYIKTILARWFGDAASFFDVLKRKSEMSDEEFLKYIDSLRHIKIIGVAGNHELQGGAKETISNTTLGLVNSLGYIDLPSKEKPLIMKDPVTGKTVAITATSYHSLMDRPEYIDDYIIKEKLGDFHIHIVHGMLVDKPLGPHRIFTTIDQIKDKTVADLTLCGHIHTGFKTVCYKNKYFVNPGAIVRLNASKDEMSRTVHVVLCEITDKITLKEIPLTSAKPAIDVLSREHILKRRKNKSIAEFYDEEVESFKLTKAKKIDDILNSVLDNEGIPEELKQIYIDKVNKKKSTIVASIPPQKDAWVKTLRIKNFQSHADQFLEFSPKMNLLVGESDNGKSAILRAIYWVYTGKPNGTSIVRRGEDTCEVEIELGNGTKVMHKLVISTSNPLKSQSNTYKITYPDGTSEEGNTRLLPKVQEVLGYCPFQVDDGKTMDINFMKQGEGWFLIGDDVSSPQRAKIVGSIMDTNCVDACMRDCEKDIQSTERQISSLTSEINAIIEQEATYSDLEDRKKTVSNLKQCYKELVEMSQKIAKIQKIYDEINLCKEKIRNCSEIIDTITKFDYNSGLAELKAILERTVKTSDLAQNISKNRSLLSEDMAIIDGLKKLPEMTGLISELSVVVDRYSKASNLSNQIESSKKIVSECSSVEQGLKNIAYIESRLKELREICDRVVAISDIDTELKKRHQYSRNTDIIISACSKVSLVGKHIEQLRNIEEKIEQIINARNSIMQSQKNITMSGYAIKKQEKVLEDIEKQKANILSMFDICPFCGQEIMNGGHNYG